MTPRWDAIIVAGGRASRLGGIDKTALVWQGRSLLDGVLHAAAGARRICVVGSDAALPAAVLRTVERPRWGGPAAAIVAALETLASAASDTPPTSGPDDDGDPTTPGPHTDGAAGTTDLDPDADDAWVVVLAADLVRPDDAVPALLAELDRVAASPAAGSRPEDTVIDGLITLDAGGRRQPLLAGYRLNALRTAARLSGGGENLSVKSLIGGLTLVELRLPDALSEDVDTPADAARLGIVLPTPAAAPEAPRSER